MGILLQHSKSWGADADSAPLVPTPLVVCPSVRPSQAGCFATLPQLRSIHRSLTQATLPRLVVSLVLTAWTTVTQS